MYNRALKRLLQKCNIEISDFDVTENMPELEAYYPSSQIEQLKHLYYSYQPEKQNEIATTSFVELCQVEGIDEFLNAFDTLLNRFGHLGDSGNDFSKPPWRETPDALVKMSAILGYRSTFETSKSMSGLV